MAMIVNTSNCTLVIGGKTLPPRGMESVDLSAKQLKEHLFVRSGLVEVSTAKTTGGENRKSPAKDEQLVETNEVAE